MKLLQFTDFHLRLTPAPESQFHVEPFWRGGTSELFSRIAKIAQTADAIAFTGDAAHGGGKEEVELFFDLLAQAAGNKPVYLVVGNHDVVHPNWQEHFRRGVEKYPNIKLSDGVYSVGETDLLLINNEYRTPSGGISPSWPDNGFPVPAISQAVAAKLDSALSTGSARPAIALIHCPVHVPPAVLYDFGKGVLAGMASYQSALGTLLDKHPRVRLVVSGHVHFNSIKIQDNGLTHLSLASVAEYPYHVRMIEIDSQGCRTQLESLTTAAEAEKVIEFRG